MSTEVNALQIATATNKVSSFSLPAVIPTEKSFIEMCQSIYGTLTAHQNFSLLDLSRCEEFRSFAYVGIPNGDVIAPAILGGHGIFELLKILTGAQNVFWHAVVSGTIFASHLFENVYVLNDTTTLIMSQESATSSISNLTTIDRDTMESDLPTLDMASVLISSVVGDYEMIEVIIDKLKTGGMLVITNSSLGGSMYDALDGMTLDETEDINIASFLHKQLLNRGDLFMYHMQGWISYTVCVKR